MFALLISTENLSEIHQSVPGTEDANLDHYINHSKNWYVVRGYIPYIGAPQDWGILPQYILDRDFEYDPDKIMTDWDQIVHL